MIFLSYTAEITLQMGIVFLPMTDPEGGQSETYPVESTTDLQAVQNTSQTFHSNRSSEGQVPIELLEYQHNQYDEQEVQVIPSHSKA